MKKKWCILFLAGILLGGTSCDKQEVNPFIQVKGHQFYYNNKPYYYLGANFWHGAYLAANLVEGDRARLLRELDFLKEYGITNLRIMASSEASELEMSVRPAFQEKPGEYNEVLLKGLDFLLNEMAARDMKAVLVLNNYWQWSGGMSQYMNWVTGDSIIDPDRTGNWDGFQFQSAGFFSNEKANELFFKYINMLINRVNTINGIIYRDDPSIMAWQLANEPRPAPDANTNTIHREEFNHWLCATAGYIRSLDSNHLISTGNEGSGGCRLDIELFSESHQCKDIDYLTFHIWPKNWGWYNAEDPAATFEPTVQNTLNYLAEHLKVARVQQKPIVLEEFGMERDSGGFSPELSTILRDKYLDLIFGYLADSAKSGSPLAGLNFWAWGGMARAGSEDFIWKPGDSFMGDPPQEHQGLNSVFSTDTSTLNVFKIYNEELKGL